MYRFSKPWARDYINAKRQQQSPGNRQPSQARFTTAETDKPFTPVPPPPETFASFILAVADLERKLRAQSVFFDTNTLLSDQRTSIGEGEQFRVDKVKWKPTDDSQRDGKWREYVAVKTVKAGVTDWKHVLLEIRALLHEPLRYHPNIARLLALGWGALEDDRTVFPTLVMEFAQHGNMASLQQNMDPLSAGIKRKLCHDVARGLQILHACNIVHGDLKHENVLIFTSNDEDTPYVAKLADFGGSAMDLGENAAGTIAAHTWPWDAPEIYSEKIKTDLRQTDIYSFGLLIWRAFLNGDNPFETAGLVGKSHDQILKMKQDGALQTFAKENLTVKIRDESDTLEVVVFALDYTLCSDASQRSLKHAYAAMKIGNVHGIPDLLKNVEEKNKKWDQTQSKIQPGFHGLTLDGLASFQAKEDGKDKDADLQEDLPGYRPFIKAPMPGEFLFEPWHLKKILDWTRQKHVVNDLTQAANRGPFELWINTEVHPGTAAFYLFMCHMHSFGVVFDPKESCRWLLKAARHPKEDRLQYLAQAWVWRVHKALGVEITATDQELDLWLKLSVMRGHRTCLEDMDEIIGGLEDGSKKKAWEESRRHGYHALNYIAGGTGMPYFGQGQMRKEWNLQNMAVLDFQIHQELGQEILLTLKIDIGPISTGWSQEQRKLVDQKRSAMDRIFVNKHGDGLLHYAASLGSVKALSHLLDSYRITLDLGAQHCYETPLVCACRAGRFDAACFLLEQGANPNGEPRDLGQETPLHWLWCFADPEQMVTIAKLLVEKGAQVDKAGAANMRPDVRNVWADWEQQLTVRCTPLTHAVMADASPLVVETLVKLGADPTRKMTPAGHPMASALELAAVLTRPRLLRTLLRLVDEAAGCKVERVDTLPSETEMLDLAHMRALLPTDVLSLQSRIVRCGTKYISDLEETMRILKERSPTSKDLDTDAVYNEVLLGNYDIVAILLKLGHSAQGTQGKYPLAAAVTMNNAPLFQLLRHHGATIDIAPGRMSLIQLSANRARTAPPGTAIAEYLLTHGVPVDPPGDQTRPAFAAAVLAGDYDLGNLLLSHGADINAGYATAAGEEPGTVTILGELISLQTELALEGIKYLLCADDAPSAPPANTPLPSMFVQQGGGEGPRLTAHAALTLSFQPSRPSSVRVVDRLAQLICASYGPPVDQDPALVLAAACGHWEIVAAFVEWGAEVDGCVDGGVLRELVEKAGIAIRYTVPQRDVTAREVVELGLGGLETGMVGKVSVGQGKGMGEGVERREVVRMRERWEYTREILVEAGARSSGQGAG